MVARSLLFVSPSYDFEGNASKDELSFQKGDFITVYGKASSEGWWVGRLQGEKKAGVRHYFHHRCARASLGTGHTNAAFCTIAAAAGQLR